MSEVEDNFVAWLRGQKMHDSASLVERLRETGDDWPACLVVLENEAADEIERLRAELAAERELREREKDAAVAMLQVKIDALASERKAKTIYYDEWQDAITENNDLRALLREARETLFAATVLISDQGFNDDAERETLARIDRALKGDGDEME